MYKPINENVMEYYMFFKSVDNSSKIGKKNDVLYSQKDFDGLQNKRFEQWHEASTAAAPVNITSHCLPINLKISLKFIKFI
jgi:hypothetical protein